MRKVTKEDIGLLVISLFIAIVLWFNVSIGRQETIAEKQFLGVKLHVIGLSNHYDCEINPQKVDVLLRGVPTDLSKVNPEDVNLTLDLTGLTEGKWFVIPQGTVPGRRSYVVKIIPDRIEVTLKEHVAHIEPSLQQSTNTTKQ